MRMLILLLALIAQDYSRFEVVPVRPSPPGIDKVPTEN
jgi:hypothetical protein